MTLNKILITILLFISLAAIASSQGYMGTVTTGTGIVPPLTVGKGTISPAGVGALSSQVNLTGSWSADLKGAQIRHLDLLMFQEGDLIQGSGRISADGVLQNVTAAGSVAGDRLTVFVSSCGTLEVFRLQLSASGSSLAGEYDALSRGTARESGTVTGNVNLASQPNQATTIGGGINPSGTSGALIGAATQVLDEESASNRLIESKSVYKSSNGQSITSSSDGSQVTTSYS